VESTDITCIFVQDEPSALGPSEPTLIHDPSFNRCWGRSRQFYRDPKPTKRSGDRRGTVPTYGGSQPSGLSARTRLARTPRERLRGPRCEAWGMRAGGQSHTVPLVAEEGPLCSALS